MTDLNKTLEERGSRYGEFDEQARITQNIKAAMRDSKNWDKLPPIMKESLEMQAGKISRILNGDPYYDDSWHDLAGYSSLVENWIHTTRTQNELELNEALQVLTPNEFLQYMNFPRSC